MKIYIMSDMEGISGIHRQEMVSPEAGGEMYQYGRKCLTEDINAAVAGAFDAGASAVVVNDGHGGGRHLLLEDADPRATYERPISGYQLMPSLDETFGGLFIVGQHAMAGTLDGFLDHTQSSTSWYNYYINGEKHGEAGQATAIAGSFGVPLLLLTGDQAACDEATRLYACPETVAVKQGHGRQHCTCIHPIRARALIHDAARRAISHASTQSPWVLTPPITVRLELYRSDMADSMADNDRVQRVDARAIEMTVTSAREIIKFA